MAWVDGSPTDYTNWADKGPDTKLLTADTCVTTRVIDGVWHSSTCGEQLGFICKTFSGRQGHVVMVIKRGAQMIIFGGGTLKHLLLLLNNSLL